MTRLLTVVLILHKLQSPAQSDRQPRDHLPMMHCRRDQRACMNHDLDLSDLRLMWRARDRISVHAFLCLFPLRALVIMLMLDSVSLPSSSWTLRFYFFLFESETRSVQLAPEYTRHCAVGLRCTSGCRKSWTVGRTRCQWFPLRFVLFVQFALYKQPSAGSKPERCRWSKWSNLLLLQCSLVQRYGHLLY